MQAVGGIFRRRIFTPCQDAYHPYFTLLGTAEMKTLTKPFMQPTQNFLHVSQRGWMNKNLLAVLSLTTSSSRISATSIEQH